MRVDKITVRNVPDDGLEQHKTVYIFAQAQVSYSIGDNSRRLEFLNSAGLSGVIEADTKNVAEIVGEQLDDLRNHLRMFGIVSTDLEWKQLTNPNKSKTQSFEE